VFVGMEQGSIKITVVPGGIAGVSINAGLALAYELLFRAAQAELRRGYTSPEVGIRLIVFGSFWLEAVCNETLRDTLLAVVVPRAFGEALWELNKRATFLDKFSVLSVFAKSNPDYDKDLFRALKEILDLRNRLAHFKDADTVVAGKMEIRDFKVGKLPDVQLIDQLRPPCTNGYAEVIITALRRFEDIKQSTAKPNKSAVRRR
jgi:hypothetical protein